jgi:hypothetical protein
MCTEISLHLPLGLVLSVQTRNVRDAKWDKVRPKVFNPIIPKYKLRGLSPKTTYTDRANAGWPAKLVQTFAERGVSRSQRGGFFYGCNLGSLYLSRYFSFHVAPQLYSRG